MVSGTERDSNLKSGGGERNPVDLSSIDTNVSLAVLRFLCIKIRMENIVGVLGARSSTL